MSGRFDWRYELNSIHAGVDRDLQKQTGQIVPWFVYDKTNTVVDPVYDVGARSGAGRKWITPVNVPVLDAIKVEDSESANTRGLYTVDSIKIIVSPQALRLVGLEDVIENPDVHMTDRVVYENKVFSLDEIRVRGRLAGGYSYTMVAIEGTQVKNEELVNDDQTTWAKYLPLDFT
jgi:hypothetical protein